MATDLNEDRYTGRVSAVAIAEVIRRPTSAVDMPYPQERPSAIDRTMLSHAPGPVTRTSNHRQHTNSAAGRARGSEYAQPRSFALQQEVTWPWIERIEMTRAGS
jgi:hypothetical protein